MPEFVVQVISGVLVGKKIRVVGELTLGRAPVNALVFSGPDATLVSGRHAVFEVRDDKLWVRDLGSTNGTWVNGEQVTECALPDNAIISFGANGPKVRFLPGGSSLGDTTTLKPHTAFGTPVEATHLATQIRAQAEAAKAEERLSQRPGIQKRGLFPGAPDAGAAGNLTIGIGERLQNDELGHQDFQNLIKDSKRADRLVQSGLVTGRDARMIQNAAAAYGRSRRRARWILGAVSGLALVVVGILLAQNLSYRSRLETQSELTRNIESLEAQLETAQAAPEGQASQDDHERALLVAKLRAAERQLMNVRSHLRAKDVTNTYRNPLGREIHAIMQDFGKRDYIVPDIFINQVEKHIRNFTRKGAAMRPIIERSLRNKKKYQSLIESELLKAGMPLAFLYLAMHESTLEPNIISHAGARGLWQFMPATAREYGLKVPTNWRDLPPEADERTHPEKATPAGIRYVKTLYAEFGDVALAMAAYNAGEGRIRRALRSIDDPVNNRDFWYIYRMGNLAKETNEYVPKIIATMIIDKNRTRYGFDP